MKPHLIDRLKNCNSIKKQEDKTLLSQISFLLSRKIQFFSLLILSYPTDPNRPSSVKTTNVITQHSQSKK